MEITRRLRAPVPATRLFAHVETLDRYPSWMRLVHEVSAAGTDSAGRPAWEVELRARVGPLARSKRLRMVRTQHDPPHRAAFERAEIDGRTHAPWKLRAEVHELTGPGTPQAELTMTLTYGGGLWTGAALERVLDAEVERGRDTLLALVSSPPTR